MNYTVHGILKARILEWVAYSFSRGSSRSRNRTGVSCIAGGFFTSWAILCPNLCHNLPISGPAWSLIRGGGAGGAGEGLEPLVSSPSSVRAPSSSQTSRQAEQGLEPGLLGRRNQFRTEGAPTQGHLHHVGPMQLHRAPALLQPSRNSP